MLGRSGRTRARAPAPHDRSRGSGAGRWRRRSFWQRHPSWDSEVAKPWGDSDAYDFIVQTSGRLWKVQVKSAHVAWKDGSCSFRAHGRSYKAYRADEIDLLVAYVVPENAWYVFPVRVIQRMKSLKLFPGSRKKRSRFEKYREASWILRRM